MPRNTTSPTYRIIRLFTGMARHERLALLDALKAIQGGTVDLPDDFIAATPKKAKAKPKPKPRPGPVAVSTPEQS